MRAPRSARAVFWAFAFGVVLALGCDDQPPPPRGAVASRPSPAPALLQDPNADNPDRDRWVDLSTVPFNPAWVGGTVVQVRPSLAPSLNAVMREGGSADVERLHKYLLGAPLLMESPDRGPDGFEARPHAAASMPEDSADHLTQTWTLRPDLTWEDGRPVVARDYVFTLGLIRNPEVNAYLQPFYLLIAGVDEIDARRFRVRWSKPHSRAIEAIGLDLQVVPSHKVPADPASFRSTPTHLACGPYRIATFEPASRIEVVLRDEYRKAPFPIRPHYVERYVYEGGASDPMASITRLINGDVHIVGMPGDNYATQGSSPAFRNAAWRTHFYIPSYTFIAWNLRDPRKLTKPHPVLGDVRVRRALSHLVPLDAIIASTHHGLARRVSGPFDPRDPGYDQGVPPFAFDPGRARALLAEAGWKAADDDVLVKDGVPCRFTLARRGGTAALSQVFQEEARKLGVVIDLEDRAKLYTEFLPARDFDAALVLWQLDAIEPDMSSQFHSRFAASGGTNFSGLTNADVDAALDKIAMSRDARERSASRRELHALLHAEVPCTFLIASATTIGVSRKVANLRVHDLGIRFHDLVMRDRFK